MNQTEKQYNMSATLKNIKESAAKLISGAALILKGYK